MKSTHRTLPCWINAWNDLWHFGHMWCETWHYGHDFYFSMVFKIYFLILNLNFFFHLKVFNFAHIFVHFDYLIISWALCFFTLPMTINWCTKVRTLIYFHLFLEFYNINTKFYMNFEFFMKLNIPIPLIWRNEIPPSPMENILKKIVYQLYQEIHIKPYRSLRFKED